MQADQQDRISPNESTAKTNNMAITAIAVVMIISIGAYQLILAENKPEPQAPVSVSIPLPDPAPAEPLPTEVDLPEPEVTVLPQAAENTSPSEAAAEPEVVPDPLPKLAESDEYAQAQVVNIANGMTITPFITQENLVRQFVVFVDNLAQGELARKVSPMNGPKQEFTVADITNKTYLNPDSFHRYDMYADLLAGIDADKLSETYQHLLPLLEEAFTELGYNDDEFTERLLQAIDVMLDAPVIDDPIELDGVSVNYQFVDPDLEALPSAQKLLVRMGPENTRKVKRALKTVRAQLDKG